MVQYVKYKTLAEWIGFSPETVRVWSKEGKLDRHIFNNEVHCSEAAIDAFLAAATNGARPVKVEDFRRGVRLLTLKQAAEMLGITPLALTAKITRKRFGGLRFDKEWRFADEAICIYKARRKGYVTRDEVMHIFGCSPTVLQRWADDGILVPVQVRGAGYWRNYYQPADVLQAIQRCLPVGARHLAPRWLFEASVSLRPPLANAEATETLGISRKHLIEMADEGRIFYILLGTSKGANRRYSPVAIETVLLQQPEWTPQDIGRVMYADSMQVYKWLSSGALACPLHNHYDLAPRYACMVAIVSHMLSPGLTARNWLQGVLASPDRAMVAMEGVAAFYGVKVTDVAWLAESGYLGGLLRPDGVWVFTRSRIQRISRAQFIRQLASRP